MDQIKLKNPILFSFRTKFVLSTIICFEFLVISNTLTRRHRNRPTSGTAVTLKTGRGKVPGSNPSCACRPSHSDFSMVFFETRVNTGQDPLERPPRRALHLQSQVPQADNWTHTYIHPFNLMTYIEMGPLSFESSHSILK